MSVRSEEEITFRIKFLKEIETELSEKTRQIDPETFLVLDARITELEWVLSQKEAPIND